MSNYQLVTVGNAIVDILCHVNDDVLEKLGLVKGSMTLTSFGKLNQMLNNLNIENFVSGGSAANTAVGFSSFGGNCCFLGNIGKDNLGKEFKKKIVSEGVSFKGSDNLRNKQRTSMSIILITPDAERTMCTFLGASTSIKLEQFNKSEFISGQIVYLEGYLFDKEETKKTFRNICEVSKKNNLRVGLSLSDTFCVERNKKDFINFIKEVDIIFCNEFELKSLFGKNFQEAFDKLRYNVKVGSITLGSKGALVFNENCVIKIDPIQTPKVLDTTGAGDLFAAGFLFGLLNQYSLKNCGILGSKSASHIISIYGARPKIKLKTLL